MSNELQNTLNEILQDKNKNLLPENLKAGITCLGVIGNLQPGGSVKGIKQFNTIEEMNQSTGNNEGDLAVVYRNEVQNMSADTQTQYITFPETVTLPEAFTDSIYMMIRAGDDTHMFDGNAMLDQSMFRFDGYSESGMIRISYSSSDGITYTRDEFTSDSGKLTNPVDLGIVIKCGMSEEWNDTFGYFMQVGGNVFEGLYECKLSETPNYDIKQINLDGSITEISDTISIDIVNTGIVKSYIAFGNPINYYPKVYIDTSRKNLIIYSSGSSSLYISTNSSYQNKILDSYSSNVSTDVFTKYCIFNIENKTTELKDLDIIGVATVNDDNIVNIPYQFFIGGFSCYDSSSGNVTVDNNVYSIKPNNFDIYKTDTSFNPTSSVVITENVGNPIVHSQLQYSLCATQLDSVANCVYKSIFYGKNGVELGTLTQNVSNQFTDMNAEVYAKIQQSYDKLEPRILTDSDKTLDKNILVVPLKSDGTQLLNTSSVTDMSNLFMNCNKLQFIFALNTINATNMSNLFRNCNNLMSIPNLDTNNVTNMTNMFRDCTNIVNIPELNTNNAIDMFCMFLNCKSLTSISNLNASNVVNMYSMFSDCTNLTTVSNLNTGEVNTTRYMFSGCTNLTNISNFNTQNVLDTYCMFSGCTNITSIPYFDTSNVTNISSMFVNCYNLTSVPNLDTSNANTMANMFVNCYNLTNIPNFDTSKVTNMHRTFAYCTNLTTIPLLDTSNVVNMYSMFVNCKNLTTIPNLNTSKVNSMGSMFADCSNLTTIPNLNASSLVRTYYMFKNCSSLTTIPNINTSKVNNMYLMFFNCSNLVDVPVLNTSNVTTMDRMFTNCSNLSNASLNNILYMCATSKPSYTNYKKLSYIGLTENQANICMTLSNYSLFTSKGWTTGY